MKSLVSYLLAFALAIGTVSITGCGGQPGEGVGATGDQKPGRASRMERLEQEEEGTGAVQEGAE